MIKKEQKDLFVNQEKEILSIKNKETNKLIVSKPKKVKEKTSNQKPIINAASKAVLEL